jgi:hypothetical protein
VLLQVVRGYEAVLTDFGSARAVPIQIGSRAAALTVQEDAEVSLEVTSYKLQVSMLLSGSGFNGEQQAGPENRTSVI